MDEEKSLEIIEDITQEVDRLGLRPQAAMEIRAWATRILEGRPMKSLSLMILESLVWGGQDCNTATGITEGLAKVLYGERWRKKLAALEKLLRISVGKQKWTGEKTMAVRNIILV